MKKYFLLSKLFFLFTIAQTQNVTVGTLSLRILSGTKSPNGSVIGNIGELYMNRTTADSGKLWIKLKGQGTKTGWAQFGIATATLNGDSVKKYAWAVTGNSGTDTSVNFIGTTDNTDFLFRRNNVFAGGLMGTGVALGRGAMENCRWNETQGNVAFGQNAMATISGGNNNVAIGSQSLTTATYGIGNVAIGSSGLNGLTSGSFNVALGATADVIDGTLSYTTTVGAGALAGINHCVALGDSGNALVGIRTAYPTAPLDVRGQIRMVDGLQGDGRVLTSDAEGNASWQATMFTTSDSAIIYALTPGAGTTYYCSDCTGDGITGRIVTYIASAWRRLKFD